jgi:regulatory protein
VLGSDSPGDDPSGGDPLDPTSAYEASDASPSPASSAALAARSPRLGRSLKVRALEYLSRREYSRSELVRKLAPFADEHDALDALIDTLEREGWLSDARFAESVVHRRAARMGTHRIVSELRRHAVDDTLIETVGAQLRETELARAQAVWRKKYGQLPQTPAERAKQARFLAMRGFSRTTIIQILKGDDVWAED